MPGADAPAASWAEKGRRPTSIVTTGHRTIRHSLHDGLRLTSRSRRSTGLVSLRRLFNRSNRLDPSVGGPRPRNLTVRLGAHRLRAFASIASRPTCRDDWPNVPLGRGGMASLNHNLRLSER